MSKQWTAVEYGKPDSVQLRDDDGVFGEVEREKAPLILAAPELLTLAKHFREWWADHFDDFSEDVNGQLLCLDNDAEAAIARIEGTP